MKLALYNHSPWFIKNLMASAYGRRLYRRRYDNEFFRRALPEVLEHNRWDEQRLAEYQDKTLQRLIRTAGEHVPYYRNLFRSRGIDPLKILTADDLSAKVPVLEKSVLRESPETLLDERKDPGGLNKLHTSGTTGTPITIYRDDAADGLAYAFYEARWRIPYGITKDSTWAMLGGKLVIPQKQSRPPFWVWNSGLNQLYMSAYHLSMEYAESYLDELRRRKLDYIHGYASSLYSLALFADKLGCREIKFKVAISNAEPFFSHQRKLVEEIFDCRTIDTYGCTEWCFQAFECDNGTMHISTDVGIFEVVDKDGRAVEPGEVGDVVCTGLLNLTQPLIRYRIGDSARLSPEKCGCGSPFPVLKGIEGRNDDLIILKDGRKVGRLDPIFKGDFPILEAQVCQNGFSDFLINVVPDAGWDKAAEDALTKSFCSYLGDVDLEIRTVERIERTKAGKFKAVVNNMKLAENDLV